MLAKKRVLIFSSFNSPPNFLGLNFEFLQREIDCGHQVFFMRCNKTFTTCGFNTYGLKYMCDICVERFNKNKKHIEGSFNLLAINEIINDEDKNYAKRSLEFVDKIQKSLVIDDFEVGESVYSSYISKTKEKDFSSEIDENNLKMLAYQSLIVYNGLKRFIVDNHIERIVLFNGRWDYYRAALSASRFAKIDIEVIENFRDGGYYEAFGNSLPHSISAKNRLISEHWNSESDLSLKEQIARDFFEKKKQGVAVYDKSFTAHQKQGFLPAFIDPEKKLIVIYNSSDFEFEAIGKEYSNPFFRDQSSCIAYVAELISSHKDFQLVIRVHPNLKDLKSAFLEEIYKLKGKYSNVFIIQPEELVDSYALMEHAYKVVTFVSTMGIEASYWGKAVILLGKSVYYYSDVAYVPKSIEEINDLLLKPLPPKPRINAEKYAYYFITGGIKAKYFKSERNRSYFKGIRIDSFSPFFKFYYRAIKALDVRN